MKFSFGIFGAFIEAINALVFAGLPTTQTLTFLSAYKFNAFP